MFKSNYLSNKSNVKSYISQIAKVMLYAYFAKLSFGSSILVMKVLFIQCTLICGNNCLFRLDLVTNILFYLFFTWIYLL